VLVPQERKADVLDAIASTTWAGDGKADRATLSRILAKAGEGAEMPASKVREHYDTINALMAGDDLLDIARRLRELQSDDAWLQARPRPSPRARRVRPR
jgi:hypothetical protein